MAEQQAMETALKYLNRQIVTKKNLTEKLLKDGFEETTVTECVEQISRWGYLNDREYGVAQIKSLQHKLKSRLYVEEYLLHSGMERQLTAELLDQYYPWENELVIAQKLVERKYVNKPTAGEKQRQFLLRSGFSENTVGQCFSAVSST